MTKPATTFFILILFTLTISLPVYRVAMPVHFEEQWYILQDEITIPIIFEDHKYTLYTVDGQGYYYYIEKGWHLHRYFPETGIWERNLITTSSMIMNVHVTANNYIFVGLNSGKLYRSIDGGKTFTLSFEWQKGGSFRSWGIASDKNWIIIGEYGMKNDFRRVCASEDWGDNWKGVYETPESEGVHIHCVAIDPYTNDWWITVGDIPAAGRVLYSSDQGKHWNDVACPNTGRPWQPYQPCNILFFEQFILIINEPLPQVFKVNRMTMKAEYITDIVNYPDHAPPYSVVVGNYGIYASLVHFPIDTNDAGIFVSYDQGYTWQRLINFTAWAEQENPSIKLSNVFGANPIIYAEGYIHANWIFWPWVEKEGIVWEGGLEGGRAFKFRDAYYISLTQRFDVISEGEDITYPIVIHSNSIVTHINFNQTLGQINFNVLGDPDALGYCNITISKAFLICKPWTIKIDDVPITDFIRTENTTHSFLYFTYSQINTRHIVIQETLDTSEVPLISEVLLTSEVLLAPILLGFMVLSAITIIITKRRLLRKPKT